MTWAPAWCIHNRQLQVLFMTQPFFMDPKSITYHQQFKQARVDTITTMSPSSACAVQEWCTSSLRCYLPYDCDCSRKEPHSNESFQPFHEACPSLCHHCRNTGHHANMCKSESSQADRPIRVSWKGKLTNLSVKQATQSASLSTSRVPVRATLRQGHSYTEIL